MKNLVLGIDIGGTNTVYGLVDVIGELYYEHSIKTKYFETMSDLIQSIKNDPEILNQYQHLIGIGIGAPNGNHFTGTIEHAPNLPWHDTIHLQAITESVFNLPCKITNDANAAALGEMLFGNAQDLKDFVTITLGTGLGSGVIVHGELVYGHDGFAGEYGHIRVVADGRICGCGRKGCLETYVSATGVTRSIKELSSPNQSTSALVQLSNPNSKDVFDYADKGDPFAIEIVDYTAKMLGNALADFTCFSSPKAFVLFGGVANAGKDFQTKVKQQMEQNMLTIFKDKVEIRISSLQDKNAAVLGAAAMIFHTKKSV